MNGLKAVASVLLGAYGFLMVLGSCSKTVGKTARTSALIAAGLVVLALVAIWI